MTKNYKTSEPLKIQHDYKIIVEAERLYSRKSKTLDRGYICEYDGEVYFVGTDDADINLLEEDCWSFFERKVYFSELDEEYETYFDMEGNIIHIVKE